MRAVFCLSYTTIVKKVVPFGESYYAIHTGYRIFLSHGDFASRPAAVLDFLAVYSSLFCENKIGFCNVCHFINAMTIRYVGQNMLEWNMGILILLNNN
jgi:hypothetical protein